MLSSNSNRQIKELIKLQNQAKYRKKSGMFVAEGAKLVTEAAHYGKLQKIYIAESSQGREEERIQPLLEEFPYEVVSEEVFAEITDTVTPQGVLGLVQMPKYTMEEILNANNQQFLLLDDLRDPGNLGTIMRTAEGAGMAAVLMSKGTVDLFNPKVVRATMGAIFRMPYCYVEDLPALAEKLREQGIAVYGTAMEGSVVYDEPDYTTGAAMVIGNVANGMSDAMFAAITDRIRIPMEGSLESVNAAVSAAIVMYDMQRQRRHR